MHRSLLILPAVVLAAVLALAAEAPPRPRPVPDVLFSPAFAVVLALADVRTLPPEARPSCRYISAYNARPEDLPKVAQALAFVLNSLSRNPLLVAPEPVGGGRRAGRLWRIDLEDYKISPKAWDRLVSKGSGRVPVGEPYHYLSVVKDESVYWPGGVWSGDGRYYAAGAYAERRRVQALAPWLPAAEAVQLAAECQTQTPICRADWLCYYALLEPRYHELLGLGDRLADVERLALVDQEVTDREGEETMGVALRSEVAEHIRGLRRSPTIRRRGRGYFWISDDYQTSIAGDDLLASADQLLDARPAAHEVIWSLPNGLQGYLVTDGQGKRIDRAAINVASDKRSGFSSVEVEIRNCVCCHANGLNPITDEVRETARGPIAAAVEALKKRDARQAQRLVDKFFATQILDELNGDCAGYGGSVRACNGLAPAANALLLREQLLRYETDLTIEELACETGNPVATLRRVIEGSAGSNLDAHVVALAGRRRLRRDQHEASAFGSLMPLLTVLKREK